MELIVFAPDALPTLMNHVFDALNGRRKVALYGEMGAGKTTFVQAICHHLGVHENATSPTYSLVNEYGYKDSGGKEATIHHIDLYRLRNAREALDIGIEDMLHDDAYCFIEWPQIIEDMLPESVAKISIEVTGPQSRKILIH